MQGKARASWTRAQTNCLRRLAAKGATRYDVAARLDRSLSAVTKRAHVLGIALRRADHGKHRQWSEQETAELRTMAAAGATLEAIGLKVNRSPGGVLRRARNLHLSLPGTFKRPRGLEWTENQLEQVKIWWRGNMSARVIAERLGGTLTRNAVIGMMWRVKCKRPHPPVERDQSRARIERFKLQNRRLTRQRRAKAAKKAAKAGKIASAVQWGGRNWYTARRPPKLSQNLSTDCARIPFTKLEHHHCRWVIGAANAAEQRNPIYCGLPREPSQPYFAAHCDRAYRPRVVRVRVQQETAPAVMTGAARKAN